MFLMETSLQNTAYENNFLSESVNQLHAKTRKRKKLSLSGSWSLNRKRISDVNCNYVLGKSSHDGGGCGAIDRNTVSTRIENDVFDCNSIRQKFRC